MLLTIIPVVPKVWWMTILLAVLFSLVLTVIGIVLSFLRMVGLISGALGQTATLILNSIQMKAILMRLMATKILIIIRPILSIFL